MLADGNTSEAAGNRIEFTTDLTRCFRLHIPHIKMAGPAIEEQNDAVIGFCDQAITFSPKCRIRKQSRCGEHSREPQAPELHNLSA